MQLVVEKIGLINTVFLKNNNEKMSCLNSVLLTKSISNLNRTSDLRVALELLVSGTTSSETISSLKLQIDKYVGSNLNLNMFLILLTPLDLILKIN